MAKNDLLHGSTGLLVMALLACEDMYGYQIIKEMKARSEDRFALQEGSLYPVLHTLEAQKLVASYEGEASGARKRRYYRLTEKGRKELAARTEDFLDFTTAARRILEFA